MTYRSRQEIFDIAYLGLKGQGFNKSTDRSMCQYRGPNGLKCAAGHLIADEDYDERLESKSADCIEVCKAMKVDLEEDGHFAHQLQCQHDNSYSPQDMKQRLLAFAKENNLTVPEEEV